MLHTLRKMLRWDRVVPVFGLNRGTVGFLMNKWKADGLEQRILSAQPFAVSPLKMVAQTTSAQLVEHYAVNEVSLLREFNGMARIEISVDGKVVLPELVCDGVLVSTPAGSTAYNMSAGGPILPLDATLLVVTPISPFRPRHWPGALVPNDKEIHFRIVNPAGGTISAVADQQEVRKVMSVRVCHDRSRELTLLFDRDYSLDERITQEQFAT
jgi:NAD+ kinase